MTTLPPPSVNEFPENSLEKKVYTIVDSFKENIPIMNDRYRLGFNLVKYLKGEGDPPEITVKNSKLSLENISEEELAQKLDNALKEIKN